ncbi:MAG: AraC family transcriptional regulator [Treponema sp.]|nr:AraC family transcriptional regulator [Treponema sp.]
MEQNYRESMETAQKNALDQIVSTMDFTWDYVQSTVSQLITNRDIIRAIIVPDMQDTARNFQIAHILNNIVSKNDLFKRVYLYIRGNDSVLSSDAKRAFLGDFWDSGVIISYLGGETGGFRINPGAIIFTLQKRVFMAMDFFFPVPNHNGVCFAELDCEVLLKTLYQNPMAQRNPVYIVDFEGEPLFLSQMQSPGRNLDVFIRKLRDNFSTEVEKIEGETLFHRFSKKTGWHYIYQVKDKHLEASRFQFLVAVLPIILFILFISILLSLYVARGIYTPIQRLIHIITSNTDYLAPQRTDSVKNEYDFLTVAFQTASQFHGKLSDMIDTVRPAVTEKLFSGLLSGKEESAEQVAATLKTIQSPFLQEDMYVVVIFCLPENYAEAASRDSLSGYSGERANLEQDIGLLAIRKQFASLLRHQDSHVLVQMSDTALAAVLRYEKNFSSRNIKQQTLALIDKIARETKPLVPSLLIGGGKSCANLMDLGRLYREAQEDVRYQTYFGANPDKEDEKSMESMQFQFYISARMSEAASQISQNKPESAEAALISLIDEIKKNADEAKRSAGFARFLTAFTAMMLSSGVPVKETVLLESNAGGPKPDNNSAVGYDYLVWLCRRGINLLAEYQKRYQHKHIIRAKEYITEHYSDNTMGLEQVADYVGIKASYLSTLFNEKLGEHFVDYLSKYRIEKAKELLGMTQTTIKEIGHITGFYSDHTFIRVFKKHERCTPGQYRDKIQQQKR